MTSFTNKSLRVLILGAVVLGVAVYYAAVASQRVEDARQALRSVDRAHSQLETARQQADKYVALLADMSDRNIDRQQPFAVVSEFSPQEFKQIAPLLDKLYQRDGHFFLQRFQLAWRNENKKLGLLPRVALNLEGRKVLLFSDEVAATSSLAVVKR